MKLNKRRTLLVSFTMTSDDECNGFTDDVCLKK